MRSSKLTEREIEVLATLEPDWMTSSRIAEKAGIRTASPRETASKFADQLVERGLAEKGGQRSAPMWRLTPKTVTHEG